MGEVGGESDKICIESLYTEKSLPIFVFHEINNTMPMHGNRSIQQSHRPTHPCHKKKQKHHTKLLPPQTPPISIVFHRHRLLRYEKFVQRNWKLNHFAWNLHYNSFKKNKRLKRSLDQSMTRKQQEHQIQ